MAVAFLQEPLSEAELVAALGSVETELAFLFENQKIPNAILGKLASFGFTDVAVWSQFGDSPEQVRKAVEKDLKIDPSVSPLHRAMVARIVNCWQVAAARSEKRRAEDAEQGIGDRPRTLPKGKHLELMRAYTAAHGELRETDTPAASLVESKLE